MTQPDLLEQHFQRACQILHDAGFSFAVVVQHQVEGSNSSITFTEHHAKSRRAANDIRNGMRGLSPNIRIETEEQQ